LLAVPTTAEALARLQAVLDDLLDLVGEDAAHPLAPWLNVIGERIETYEAQHYPSCSRPSGRRHPRTRWGR